MGTLDFVSAITDGSLLLAIPVAILAGLVSFLSPCVLPLVPGYLSYVTGVAGARGRAILGTVLFVSGFSLVFVSFGALFGGIGTVFIKYQRELQIGLGIFVIVMGLSFLGRIPFLSRDLRLHRTPSGTLAGAPLLGILFGLGWTPCIGPTLGAVQTLALNEASALRGAILALAYCVGLGLPFVILAAMLDRSFSAVKALRKHAKLVMRFGGLLLIVIGVLLVTGLWNELTIQLRIWAADFTVAI